MALPDADPAWAAPDADAIEDPDEPPEIRLQQTSPQRFRRTAIRQPSAQSSLLTMAIMGHSDDDTPHDTPSNRRRRSMTSNASVASTAELTSDTGLTSPCRTNTPSPPISDILSLRLEPEVSDVNKRAPLGIINLPEPPQEPPRRRCIQFACAAKPLRHEQSASRAAPPARTTSTQEPPRRPCIKFACPSALQFAQDEISGPQNPSVAKPDASSTPKKTLALPASPSTPSQPMALRRPSSRNTLTRPKFLRATSKDLANDAWQFHEFASGTAREEEWIRQGVPVVTTKLTINVTLTKENHIRRLGAEAEEEAALEDEEAEAATDDEDPDDLDGDQDQDGVEDEEQEDKDEDEEDSDGYYTDEETGFAESDDEEDDDENMRLWTPSHGTNFGRDRIFASRRPSLNEPQSDSSVATYGGIRHVIIKRAKPSSDTPNLPDSTDFVCGTLDEDKPLEEAYLSCLAARRNEKLRIIPQDIDPSFPASDPDDDDEEDIFNPVAHDSDADVLVHGEMEDLHHGQDRSRRRRRSEHASPRKYRSPAPKRHHSPPPKTRPRSPKTLFGRQSPRRMRSPAPRALTTPVGSPRHGAHVQFPLAGRPHTTHTKSLPRPTALFPCLKKERSTRVHHHDSDLHIRGAIDIVKGLERKRQRRKEKYYQRYCNRARRGQIPERKPQPGRGAERMRELGLLMAGKKEPGNYVLSI